MSFWDGLKKVVTGATDVLSGVAGGIKDAKDDYQGRIQERTDNTRNNTNNAWVKGGASVLGGAGKIATGLVGDIAESVPGVISTVGKVVTGQIDWSNPLSDPRNQGDNKFETVINSLENAYEQDNIWSSLARGVLDIPILGSGIKALSKTGVSLADDVLKSTAKIGTEVVDDVAKGTAKTVAGTTGEAVSNVAKTGNLFTDAVGRTTTAVKEFVQGNKTWGGVGKTTLGLAKAGSEYAAKPLFDIATTVYNVAKGNPGKVVKSVSNYLTNPLSRLGTDFKYQMADALGITGETGFISNTINAYSQEKYENKNGFNPVDAYKARESTGDSGLEYYYNQKNIGEDKRLYGDQLIKKAKNLSENIYGNTVGWMQGATSAGAQKVLGFTSENNSVLNKLKEGNSLRSDERERFSEGDILNNYLDAGFGDEEMLSIVLNNPNLTNKQQKIFGTIFDSSKALAYDIINNYGISNIEKDPELRKKVETQLATYSKLYKEAIASISTDSSSIEYADALRYAYDSKLTPEEKKILDDNPYKQSEEYRFNVVKENTDGLGFLLNVGNLLGKGSKYISRTIVPGLDKKWADLGISSFAEKNINGSYYDDVLSQFQSGLGENGEMVIQLAASNFVSGKLNARGTKNLDRAMLSGIDKWGLKIPGNTALNNSTIYKGLMGGLREGVENTAELFFMDAVQEARTSGDQADIDSLMLGLSSSVFGVRGRDRTNKEMVKDYLSNPTNQAKIMNDWLGIREQDSDIGAQRMLNKEFYKNFFGQVVDQVAEVMNTSDGVATFKNVYATEESGKLMQNLAQTIQSNIVADIEASNENVFASPQDRENFTKGLQFNLSRDYFNQVLTMNQALIDATTKTIGTYTKIAADKSINTPEKFLRAIKPRRTRTGDVVNWKIGSETIQFTGNVGLDFSIVGPKTQILLDTMKLRNDKSIWSGKKFVKGIGKIGADGTSPIQQKIMQSDIPESKKIDILNLLYGVRGAIDGEGNITSVGEQLFVQKDIWTIDFANNRQYKNKIYRSMLTEWGSEVKEQITSEGNEYTGPIDHLQVIDKELARFRKVEDSFAESLSDGETINIEGEEYKMKQNYKTDDGISYTLYKEGEKLIPYRLKSRGKYYTNYYVENSGGSRKMILRKMANGWNLLSWERFDMASKPDQEYAANYGNIRTNEGQAYMLTNILWGKEIKYKGHSIERNGNPYPLYDVSNPDTENPYFLNRTNTMRFWDDFQVLNPEEIESHRKKINKKDNKIISENMEEGTQKRRVEYHEDTNIAKNLSNEGLGELLNSGNVEEEVFVPTQETKLNDLIDTSNNEVNTVKNISESLVVPESAVVDYLDRELIITNESKLFNNLSTKEKATKGYQQEGVLYAPTIEKVFKDSPKIRVMRDHFGELDGRVLEVVYDSILKFFTDKRENKKYEDIVLVLEKLNDSNFKFNNSERQDLKKIINMIKKDIGRKNGGYFSTKLNLINLSNRTTYSNEFYSENFWKIFPEDTERTEVDQEFFNAIDTYMSGGQRKDMSGVYAILDRVISDEDFHADYVSKLDRYFETNESMEFFEFINEGKQLQRDTIIPESVDKDILENISNLSDGEYFTIMNSNNFTEGQKQTIYNYLKENNGEKFQYLALRPIVNIMDPNVYTEYISEFLNVNNENQLGIEGKNALNYYTLNQNAVGLPLIANGVKGIDLTKSTGVIVPDIEGDYDLNDYEYITPVKVIGKGSEFNVQDPDNYNQIKLDNYGNTFVYRDGILYKKKDEIIWNGIGKKLITYAGRDSGLNVLDNPIQKISEDDIKSLLNNETYREFIVKPLQEHFGEDKIQAGTFNLSKIQDIKDISEIFQPKTYFSYISKLSEIYNATEGTELSGNGKINLVDSMIKLGKLIRENSTDPSDAVSLYQIYDSFKKRTASDNNESTFSNEDKIKANIALQQLGFNFSNFVATPVLSTIEGSEVDFTDNETSVNVETQEYGLEGLFDSAIIRNIKGEEITDIESNLVNTRMLKHIMNGATNLADINIDLSSDSGVINEEPSRQDVEKLVLLLQASEVQKRYGLLDLVFENASQDLIEMVVRDPYQLMYLTDTSVSQTDSNIERGRFKLVQSQKFNVAINEIILSNDVLYSKIIEDYNNTLKSKKDGRADALKSLESNDVTVITGLAGSGKTTMVVNYLKDKGITNYTWAGRTHQVKNSFNDTAKKAGLVFDPKKNLSTIDKLFEQKYKDGNILYELARDRSGKPLLRKNSLLKKGETIIIDEGQSVDPLTLQVIVEQLGQNNKIIIMGDENQNGGSNNNYFKSLPRNELAVLKDYTRGTEGITYANQMNVYNRDLLNDINMVGIIPTDRSEFEPYNGQDVDLIIVGTNEDRVLVNMQNFIQANEKGFVKLYSIGNKKTPEIINERSELKVTKDKFTRVPNSEGQVIGYSFENPDGTKSYIDLLSEDTSKRDLTNSDYSMMYTLGYAITADKGSGMGVDSIYIHPSVADRKSAELFYDAMTRGSKKIYYPQNHKNIIYLDSKGVETVKFEGINEITLPRITILNTKYLIQQLLNGTNTDVDWKQFYNSDIELTMEDVGWIVKQVVEGINKKEGDLSPIEKTALGLYEQYFGQTLEGAEDRNIILEKISNISNIAKRILTNIEYKKGVKTDEKKNLENIGWKLGTLNIDKLVLNKKDIDMIDSIESDINVLSKRYSKSLNNKIANKIKAILKSQGNNIKWDDTYVYKDPSYVIEQYELLMSGENITGDEIQTIERYESLTEGEEISGANAEIYTLDGYENILRGQDDIFDNILEEIISYIGKERFDSLGFTDTELLNIQENILNLPNAKRKEIIDNEIQKKQETNSNRIDQSINDFTSQCS